MSPGSTSTINFHHGRTPWRQQAKQTSMAHSLAGQGYSGGIDVTLPIAMTIGGLFALAVFNVIRDQLLDLYHLSATCGAILLEFTYSFLGDTYSRDWIPIKVFPDLHYRIRQCRPYSCWLVRNGHRPINRPILSTPPRCSGQEENPMDFGTNNCRLCPLPHSSHAFSFLVLTPQIPSRFLRRSQFTKRFRSRRSQCRSLLFRLFISGTPGRCSSHYQISSARRPATS